MATKTRKAPSSGAFSAPKTAAKPHKHCVRCDCAITEHSGVVRMLCSSCDFDLQTMHWQVEYRLFGKPTYMPEAFGEPQSAAWFRANGYDDFLSKPFAPKRRDYFRPPPPEARAM